MTQRRRYFLWWSLLLLACMALFLTIHTDVLGSSTTAGHEDPAAYFTDSSGPEYGNGNSPGSSAPSGSSSSDLPSEPGSGPITFAGSQTNDAPACFNSWACQDSIGGGDPVYGTISQSGGSGPSGGGGGQAPHDEGSFAHNLLGFFTGWGGSSGSSGGGLGNAHGSDGPGTPGTNASGDSPSNSGGSQEGTPGTNLPGDSSSDPGNDPLGPPLADPIGPLTFDPQIPNDQLGPPLADPIGPLTFDPQIPNDPLPPTYPRDGPPWFDPPILNDGPGPSTTGPVDGPPLDQGNSDPPGGGPNGPTDPGFDPPNVAKPIPEPETLAIVAAGFAALLMGRRRKTRRAEPVRG